MFSVVTGKQRSGKSYYVVTLFIEYLLHSHRFIYTNLPINPDFLCNYIGKKIRAKVDYYMCRLFIFLPDREVFNGVNTGQFKIPLSEYKEFSKKNPHFLHNHFKNLLGESIAREFWNYTRKNSVVFLDEVYELFGCMNYKDASLSDWRMELMKYSRQHAHRGDDVFLISHNYQDLDSFLRRGIQYMYIISNSKYTNIFDNKIMRGLKYPIQFFIVEGFEFGETIPSDRFHVYPKKQIFKCYESFSAPKGLGNSLISDSGGFDDDKGTAYAYYDLDHLKQFESTDTGVNFKANFKRFFKQFFPWLVFGSAGFVFCLFMFFQLRNLIDGTGAVVTDVIMGDKNNVPENGNKEIVSNVRSENVVVESEVDLENNSGVKKKVKEKKRPKITGITPNCVYWSDGFKMRINDIYQGLKIEKITKNYIIVSADGKRHKISVHGSRDFDSE